MLILVRISLFQINKIMNLKAKAFIGEEKGYFSIMKMLGQEIQLKYSCIFLQEVKLNLVLFS